MIDAFEVKNLRCFKELYLTELKHFNMIGVPPPTGLRSERRTSTAS